MLRFLTGPQNLKGKTVALVPGRSILGKGDSCEIQVPDPGVSWKHCCFEVSEDFECTIQDLDSTNRTMLGSLEQPTELDPAITYVLHHGDTIVVGANVVCVFLSKSESSHRQHTFGMGSNHATSLNTTHLSDDFPSRASTAMMSSDELRDTVEGLMAGMQTLYSIIGRNGSDGPNPTTQSTSRKTTATGFDGHAAALYPVLFP